MKDPAPTALMRKLIAAALLIVLFFLYEWLVVH